MMIDHDEVFFIIPEYPYQEYSIGKVTIHSRDFRRTISLSAPKKTSIRTTYARYILQVHLWKTKKELIPDYMEVDHINENKLDDRIENLQLLTKEQNVIKNNFFKGSSVDVICCPMCGKLFQMFSYENASPALRSCSDECQFNFFASNISLELRNYLIHHQKKMEAREFKLFPEGYVYKVDILTINPNCFYPNSLLNHKEWITHLLTKDLKLVDVNKRKEQILALDVKGMSERKIASLLGISRSIVQTALDRSWRIKNTKESEEVI